MSKRRLTKYTKDKEWQRCVPIEAAAICALIEQDRVVIEAKDITAYAELMEAMEDGHEKASLLGSTCSRMGHLELRHAVEDKLIQGPKKPFSGTRVVPMTAYAIKTYGHMPSEAELESRVTHHYRKYQSKVEENKVLAAAGKPIKKIKRKSKKRKMTGTLQDEIVTEYRRCVAGHHSTVAYHVVLPENILTDRFLAILDNKRENMGCRSLKPFLEDLVMQYRLGQISKPAYLEKLEKLQNMLVPDHIEIRPGTSIEIRPETSPEITSEVIQRE